MMFYPDISNFNGGHKPTYSGENRVQLGDLGVINQPGEELRYKNVITHI